MSDALLSSLVAADREHRSWLRKLRWLRDWLVAASAETGANDREDATDAARLAYIAIYLRLLGTGALACEEDGGHHRPSHHAQLSREINALLVARGTPQNAPLLRRIYPWLPSFDAAYTRAEPLTRIRDIAHRDDIPSELKREIKTRLQNKLHRCADPGDMVTAREIFARVSAPDAGFPAPFVAELRRFLRELEEFFGAAGLVPMLEAAIADDGALARAGERLLSAHSAPQSAMPSDVDALLDELALVDALRAGLGVAEGDASERARRRRILDLRLEEHAFARGSELLNALERLPEPVRWKPGLAALAALLCGLERGELPAAGAPRRELDRWRADFEPRDKDQLLRLKALVDRCAVLLGEHTEGVLELFARRVEALGLALGVAPHAISTFVEGDLRGGLPFLLSRLCRLLARMVRRATGLSPWLPLVPGRAAGRLVASHELGLLAAALPASSEAVIAVCQRASGDETIPPRVRGILLGHDLPQLSHLGVRARQAGVVFACCDDIEHFRALAQRIGEGLMVSVDVETGLTLSEVGPQALALRPAVAAVSPPSADIALPDIHAGRVIVGLEALETKDGGGKAAGAARLLALSAEVDGAFSVPAGLVVPLGVFEASLAETPARARRYWQRVDELAAQEDAALAAPLSELAAIVSDVRVPGEIGARARADFGAGTRLMVRSSSNLEDRAEDAGAGLYESVANVALDSAGALDDAIRAGALDDAIRAVWASLWTRRAVLARRRQGVADRAARMAVLLQPLVVGELSFILHTVNPLSGRRDEAYAELAAGHGEVLASGAVRGTPFRLVCQRPPGDGVTVLSFASFDRALRPGPGGGLVAETLDYGTLAVARDATARDALGRRLARLADQLEDAFGAPQDVEGVISAGEIWVVQARPQQGLTAKRGDKEETVGNEEREGGVRLRPRHEHIDSGGQQTAAEGAEGAESAWRPPIFSMLGRQIRGDDALFALAERRFTATGIGAEVYAADAEQLESRLRYAPGEQAMVHLPRDLDLLDPDSRRFIADVAARFGGRLRGMVLHDQHELVDRPEVYLRAVRDLSEELAARAPEGPTAFIEYAIALDPRAYQAFFERAGGLPGIGACLDIGHVGIYAARQAFASTHPGEDVCALAPYHPRLADVVDDLERAVRGALPVVLELLSGLGAVSALPVHFHLHDGHPLWALNPFGVSDHMSFFDRISIPCAGPNGTGAMAPLFGPAGLGRIVAAARTVLAAERVSLTLEIHPQPGQMALAEDEAAIFSHWKDQTNAERMSYWLEIITKNARLLSDLVGRGRATQ